MGRIKKLFHLWFHPERPKNRQELLIEIIEIRICLPFSCFMCLFVIPMYVVICGLNLEYIGGSFVIGACFNILWVFINLMCTCINLIKH